MPYFTEFFCLLKLLSLCINLKYLKKINLNSTNYIEFILYLWSRKNLHELIQKD